MMKKSRLKFLSFLALLLGLGLPVQVNAGDNQSKKAMTFEDFLNKRETAFDIKSDEGKSDKHFPG
jgi:hypothetical protein